MPSLVYINVLSYNTPWDLLSRCLRSLRSTIYPNYKVVLVDNASTDDSVANVRSHFPEVEEILQNDRNSGYSSGNNIGIRHALAHDVRYCVLLNPDTAVVDPYWLAKIVQLAESQHQIGLLGCEEVRDPAQIVTGDESVYGSEYTPRMWDAPKASGAAMLVSAELVKAIGLFDEAYFAYAEEDDLAYRARQAGFAVKTSNIPIFHEHHGSWGRHRLRASYLSMRNMIRFAIKHHGLIGILREIARTLYLACNPAVAKRVATEPPVRRIRYSENVLVNFGIFSVALLWNLVFLPSTLRRRHTEQTLIRAYRRQLRDRELFGAQ